MNTAASQNPKKPPGKQPSKRQPTSGSRQSRALVAAIAKIDQLEAALRQERSDLANMRRRFVQEKVNLSVIEKVALLEEMLPILDNLQRAFAAPPEDIQNHLWVKGVLGIRQQLASWLSQLGVVLIPTQQQMFDPRLMEAVETVADKTLEDGLVVEEILTGYRYQDRVLRPAQVKVVRND